MEEAKCINCNKLFKYRPRIQYGKFCSNKCQHDYRRNVVTKNRFLEGNITERKTIRRILSEERGYFCEVCGIDSWNGKDITLQVDHVDGDASNNSPKNIRLICPNCHSQTDTFSGANKGNGRKSRGLPLN